jgi:hypothetical protein
VDVHRPASQRRGQYSDCRGQKLHSRHRDRVPAAQQPGLRDGEAGRGKLPAEHEAVSAETRAGTLPACDEADAGQ